MPRHPAAFLVSFKHNPTLLALLVEELLVECAVNTVTSIPESS